MVKMKTMEAEAIEIPATELKAKCLALLDEIALTGRSVVITKRGKPVAKVSPIEGTGPPPLLGSVVSEDDIVWPTEEAWGAGRCFWLRRTGIGAREITAESFGDWRVHGLPPVALSWGGLRQLVFLERRLRLTGVGVQYRPCSAWIINVQWSFAMAGGGATSSMPGRWA